MSGLTLRLLGEVSLRRGDHALTGLPSRKAEALVIYLACTRRPVAREVLADLLWDDRSPEQALANLRTLLSSLKRALSNSLLITRDTITFNRESTYWLDVEVFEAHLAESRSTAAEASSRLSQLLSAAEVYRGDFLAGFHLRQSRGFEEWATLERERLHRLAVLGLWRLVQHHLESGEYAAGLDFAARLVRLDALSEAAQRALMLLLARTGQRTAALAQYEACRRALVNELGVAPADETIALYAHLRSATTLGTHNLPPLITEFIGRETEVQELATRLARPTSRLITLLGPGGMGKSRLAIETARHIITHRPGAFLHGVRFAPLAGLLLSRPGEGRKSDATAAQVLAAAVVEAVQAPGSDEPRERLLRYLEEREVLLVLDNFEHLLRDGHAGTDLLAELLARAPRLKLLVTSRERLNLREEELFDVPGLDLPVPGAADAEASSAVRLFVAQARRARRDFGPAPDDMRAIIQLCRLLDGAPLGIELAAAAVRQQTCAEIAAALERSLDAVATVLYNIPERHRSLRAAFEHSWGLLDGAAQAQFARLSIFPESFTAEAAGLAQVEAASLAQLADKSLLQRRASGRYQIQPLVRQYAAEKLSERPDQHQAVALAHCRYYAHRLAQHATWLTTGRPQQAMEDMAAELGNLRAAWDLAVRQRQPVEIGQMLDSLTYFYVTRGWLEEGCAALQRATEAWSGAAEADTLLIARLEARQAECQVWLSNFDVARRLLETSTASLRQRRAWQPLAWAYDLWCILAYQQGQYAEARQHGEASLALFRQLGERMGMAQALNNLANVLCDEAADYQAADQLYEESLTIYREAGDLFGQAKCLINLGSTAQMRDEAERARQFYQQGIDICRASPNRPMLAIALTNLGQLLSTLGQQVEAEQCLLESLELKREFGHRRSIAFSLKRLGTVATRLGRYAPAKDYYDEALRLSQQLGSPTLAADILIGVAGLMHARGQVQPALEVLAAVQQHTANDQEILNEAARQLAEISGQVSPDVAAACQVRGRARGLAEVVAQVLSEPVGAPPP